MAMATFKYPPVSLSDLKSRGYELKVAPARKLTPAERETIESAVQSLNGQEGAAIMGNFKNIANWISTVHLQGTRTSRTVARYLAALVARLHKNAVEAGKTTGELPDSVKGLTQMAGMMDEGAHGILPK